ncbi:RBBP9/YdeN family alpha/beta hydrolase [Chitinophaga nivalis]|uniref:Alpha/beta hydrolase n=1 Tax=Chitinophaga nivalis TaxID=2991709 RepID=A0ABT3IHH3_9BACT|nr:alpha/beta hydrolase [Chitinophaga nivalis]MCW3466902.1 alpha/beta hydrolase [Chitinophaga nivalis]MCW3483407.1 alpha/beta hydrolase [Chitinophaga nivalis]
MEIKVLTAPGLGGSGPLHWQSRWEQSIPGTLRIEQSDWDTPSLNNWINKLEAAISAAGPQVVIAAHSLGCIALAHWAQQTHLTIAGALLVAPPDVERPDFPEVAASFNPVPLKKLPFKSILIASTNDAYCSLERAALLAKHWGSSFVNAGAKGHINADSNLEEWQEGKDLLSELVHNRVTL